MPSTTVSPPVDSNVDLQRAHARIAALERELADVRRCWRDALTASADGYGEWDLRSDCAEISGGLARVLGVPDGRVDGVLAQMPRFVSAAALDEVSRRVAEVKSSAAPVRFELELVGARGQTFCCDVTAVAIGGSMGDAERIIFWLRDVSAAKARSSERATVIAQFDEQFGALEIGAMLKDDRGVIVRTNAAAARMVCVPAERLAGMTTADPALDVRGEDGAELPFDLHPSQRCIRTGEAIGDVVLGQICGDGRRRWFNCSASPRFDAHGRVDYVTCCFTDITSQREMTDQLRASETRYRELINGVEAVAWEARVDGRMTPTFISGHAKMLLGYDEQRWYEPGFWFRLVHPDDAAELMRQTSEWIATRTSFTASYRMIAADGSVRWVGDRVRVIREDGKPALLRGVLVDVTSQRTAQDALRESEEWLRLTTEGGQVGLWDWDLITNDVQYSASWKRLLGHEDGEIGRGLAEWTSRMHPAHLASAMQHMQAAIDDPAASTVRKECFMRHKDGSYRWLMGCGTITRDATGKATRIRGSAVDVTAAKRLELAARDRDAYARRLIDSLPAMVWRTDAKGAGVHFNKTWTDYVGMSLEEQVAEGGMSVLHPDDVAGTEAACAQASAARRNFLHEYRIRRHDGVYRWFLASGQPTYREDGTFDGYVGSCVDITERKEADTALRESEEWLRVTIEGGSVGPWDWDLLADEVQYSAGWKRLIGYEDHEIGRGIAEWASRVHPDDLTATLALVESAKTDPDAKSVRAEFRIRHRDGGWRWLLACATIQRDESGRAVRLRGCSVDTTAAKLVEQTARDNELRFRELVDALPAMVWTSDEAGNCTYFSRSCTEFVGLSSEAQLGDAWEVVLHPDERQAVHETFALAVVERRPASGVFRMRRADGVYRWVLDVATPRFAADGRFLGHVGSVVDITDQKALQDTLREREAWLRLVIEASGVGFWDWDIASGTVHRSPLWLRQLGYGGDEIGSAHADWVELLHPDDRERVVARADRWKQLQPGEPLADTYRIRHRDGSFRHMLTHGSVLRNERGEAVRIIGCHIDITDQERAKEVLRESERRFQELIDAIPVMVWTCDPQGKCTYVNKTCCKYLGLPYEKLLADGWVHTLHPDESTRFLPEFQRRVAASLPVEGEFVLRNASGEWRSVMVLATPQFDADRRCTGYVGTVLDIHPLREAELAVRESEHRFRQFAEHMPFVVWMSEVNKRELIYVSSDVQALNGVTSEQLLTDPLAWVATIHPEDRTWVADKLLNARDDELQIELRIVRPDGTVRWVRDHGIGIRDASGEVYMRAGICEDITEQKQMQDELTRYREHLEQLVQERTAELIDSQRRLADASRLSSIGTLAAGMAHEINNPLGLIMLSAEQATAEFGEHPLLSEIRELVRRCSRIVRSVLKFARSEETERWSVPLAGVIDKACDLARGTCAQAGVEVIRDADMPALCVTGNATELEQVFVNLILNAVHASTGRTPVRLSLQRVGESAVVCVRDDGIGMSREHAARVFDPFFTTRTDIGGTGLGLSICYGIVKSHGGTIRIDSEPNRGTTVTVELPLAAE